MHVNGDCLMMLKNCYYSTCTLSIIVENIDDTPPTFKQTVYKFKVSENQPKSTIVGQVEAEDKDSSFLTYTLETSGKCIFSQFNLNSEIRTNI